VLARAPIPGAVKAELCPPLSASAAAELCTALLNDTLHALNILPMALRAVLAAPEEDGVARLREIVPSRWQVVAQRGATLEERLSAAFADLFAPHTEAAAIVVSDAPAMPVDEVFEGMMWLTKGRRMLLGPTENGTAYLIGTTHAEPALFEGTDWSSPGTFERVRARAGELGIEVQTLSAAYAVDTPADIKRLAADAGRGMPHGMGAPACTALFKQPDFQQFK
jgi:hypothetical protein